MNNLMQRRRQQMQNMPMPQQDNSFNDWYNVGSAVGGAAFGGIKARSDGQYDGHDLTKMDGYDKNLSDKQNWNNLNGTSLDGISNDFATDFPDQANKQQGVLGSVADTYNAFSGLNGGVNLGNFANGVDLKSLDPEQLKRLLGVVSNGGGIIGY